MTSCVFPWKLRRNRSVCCACRSVMSDSLLQPATLLCPWGFCRQEYWSGSPCPLPGDLPKPGIKPRSPAWQVDSEIDLETPNPETGIPIKTIFLLYFPFCLSCYSECALKGFKISF